MALNKFLQRTVKLMLLHAMLMHARRLQQHSVTSLCRDRTLIFTRWVSQSLDSLY